jgi:hypothetical protein
MELGNALKTLKSCIKHQCIGNFTSIPYSCQGQTKNTIRKLYELDYTKDSII